MIDGRVKCKFCGYRGKAKMKWRGQKWVAQLLWMKLLIPGPLYNYWQWQGRKQVCPECESDNLIPDDGNDRFETIRQLEKEIEASEKKARDEF